MKKECKVLRAQPMGSMLHGVYLLALSAFLLLLPFLLDWEAGAVEYRVLFYIFISFLIGYGIVVSFSAMQYVTMTDTKIVIKGLLMKPVALEWDAVKTVTKETLLTYHRPSGPVYLEYIVIRTDETVKTIIPQKQTARCCQIFASKKNVDVMLAYIKKHNHICSFG